MLIHLLPGLALFAQRHFSPPESVSRISLLSSTQYGRERDGSATFWWFLVAPFIFYATWQTAYWLTVQVNYEPSDTEPRPSDNAVWKANVLICLFHLTCHQRTWIQALLAAEGSHAVSRSKQRVFSAGLLSALHQEARV